MTSDAISEDVEATVVHLGSPVLFGNADKIENDRYRAQKRRNHHWTNRNKLTDFIKKFMHRRKMKQNQALFKASDRLKFDESEVTTDRFDLSGDVLDD